MAGRRIFPEVPCAPVATGADDVGTPATLRRHDDTANVTTNMTVPKAQTL